MSESSVRLPENEVGGHPQTGEGAVRRLDRDESVTAGDPRLAAALESAVEVAEPEPDPEPEPEPAPAPAPLIPPVVPAEPQE